MTKLIDGDEDGVIKTGKQRLELCYVAQGGDGSLAANLTTSRSSTTLAKPMEVVPVPGICSSVVREEDDPMGLRAGIWQVMEAKKNNAEGTSKTTTVNEG